MSDLKKTTKATLAMLVVLGALAGCQKKDEGPAEAAGKQIDQVIEKSGEKVDQATGAIGKSIEQAGQNMQDSTTREDGKQ
ncbi:hypothetical protein [Aquabacterium sp. A08]|uniref:hypothetical protein n=1 Tax=Aquabacterium sp. A08 TaxID=2718532 RepID=UPI0014205427|nr:hypothetical protein [Aquabacterium sp. A08]NIC40869.1 hypothetical protein [Aquabacterium sp. A08]